MIMGDDDDDDGHYHRCHHLHRGTGTMRKSFLGTKAAFPPAATAN